MSTYQEKKIAKELLKINFYAHLLKNMILLIIPPSIRSFNYYIMAKSNKLSFDQK